VARIFGSSRSCGIRTYAGIPAAVGGDTTVLLWCVGGYLVSALASAGLRYLFLNVSGRVGQDVLIELRQGPKP